jgi:hypothetical protein
MDCVRFGFIALSTRRPFSTLDSGSCGPFSPWARNDGMAITDVPRIV